SEVLSRPFNIMGIINTKIVWLNFINCSEGGIHAEQLMKKTCLQCWHWHFVCFLLKNALSGNVLFIRAIARSFWHLGHV
ncbi:hypothetical protein P3707_27045, partial [Vibrio parahaemolyticus]|nr:hypothetical protein [Vibrio parahaemolyticus]